jgi:hypothetical protein
MTPRFSGSSIFTNTLAILPILFLTLNQFIWKTLVATVATLFTSIHSGLVQRGTKKFGEELNVWWVVYSKLQVKECPKCCSLILTSLHTLWLKKLPRLIPKCQFMGWYIRHKRDLWEIEWATMYAKSTKWGIVSNISFFDSSWYVLDFGELPLTDSIFPYVIWS